MSNTTCGMRLDPLPPYEAYEVNGEFVKVKNQHTPKPYTLTQDICKGTRLN